MHMVNAGLIFRIKNYTTLRTMLVTQKKTG